MKELYRKGVATHPDPESCAGVREDAGEALTGEGAGKVSSRERHSRAPTLLSEAEGNTDVDDNASRRQALRGRRPLACADTPRTGTGRSRCPRPAMSRTSAWERPKAAL